MGQKVWSLSQVGTSTLYYTISREGAVEHTGLTVQTLDQKSGVHRAPADRARNTRTVIQDTVIATRLPPAMPTLLPGISFNLGRPVTAFQVFVLGCWVSARYQYGSWVLGWSGGTRGRPPIFRGGSDGARTGGGRGGSTVLHEACLAIFIP